VTPWRLAPVMLVAALALICGGTVAAEAVSPPVYDALQRVRAQVARGDRGAAVDALQKLKADTAADSYDRTVVLRTLASVYEEREQYDAAIDVLMGLLRRAPSNAGYWRDLYGLELRRGRYDRAAGALSLAQRLGLLRGERDILQLASLYRLAGMPYQGGVLLERDLTVGRLEPSAARWQLAAEAWLQAQELDRALGALDRALALRARQVDAALVLRLGEQLLQRGHWESAVGLLRRASGRVPAADRGRVFLRLGIAYAEQRADAAARQALEEARRYAESRAVAERWLGYLGRTKGVVAGGQPPNPGSSAAH